MDIFKNHEDSNASSTFSLSSVSEPLYFPLSLEGSQASLSLNDDSTPYFLSDDPERPLLLLSPEGSQASSVQPPRSPPPPPPPPPPRSPRSPRSPPPPPASPSQSVTSSQLSNFAKEILKGYNIEYEVVKLLAEDPKKEKIKKLAKNCSQGNKELCGWIMHKFGK